MLFSSTVFVLFFLPITIFFYYTFFVRSRVLQNVFLLFSSLIFYAWGEPWFVFVMIGSIIINWIFGLFVDKYRGNKVKIHVFFCLMLFTNLGILFIFKYLNFTLHNINSLLKLDFYNPTIVLPIGISFFTFQAISYVIDVYNDKGEAQKNPLNVGLYIAFFPQLIAGPIVRYQTISEQINNRKENFNDFSNGVCRFIIGFSKKVLLANSMSIIAGKAFSLPANQLSIAFAWIGAIAYTLQIFFDFSGYSDMAIGLGKMFGFHFLENFNYPYISKSISEFWRRWHISLGTWFRDYVYIPLGGSRVSTKKRLICNLFIVWVLTGIWHGAKWSFIIWGLMYFVLISFEKLVCFEKRIPGLVWFKHSYTLFFVILGWVIFRSETFKSAIVYLKIMFGLSESPFFDNYVVLYLFEYKYFFLSAFIFSTPIARVISCKIKQGLIFNIAYVSVILSLFVLSISALFKGQHNPFIYFNF